MQPGSIRHLFRLKRACKTEANLKYVLHTKRFSSCFAVLFFCAFLRAVQGMSDSFVSCLHDCEAILSMTYSATARHEQDAKRLRMHAYCILSEFASVLEGTGKGADYEEGKQK